MNFAVFDFPPWPYSPAAFDCKFSFVGFQFIQPLFIDVNQVNLIKFVGVNKFLTKLKYDSHLIHFMVD